MMHACEKKKRGGKGGERGEEPACQTVLVAFRHPHQGLGVSVWCAKKAFSIGILADAFEDGAHSRGESLLADRIFGGGGIKAREG